MANKISTGAYVIRNRSTSLALHISTDNKTWSSVHVFQQDENQYRGQQIWWIEPLPDTNPDEEDVVYNIINTSSGMSLDRPLGGGLAACRTHGSNWQTWTLRKVRTGSEGACYNIISTYNGEVVDIKDTDKVADTKGTGPACCTSEYIPDNDRQCWEFIIPVVGFPAGWFQIQNVSTGDFLTHKYLYNPPILLPLTASTRPSQDLESWGTQWTLAQAGKNSWYIVNRLTGGGLSNPSYIKENSRHVAAWRHMNAADSLWKLELDPAKNWTIMHHGTSLLLEQTTVPRGGGTEVACVEKWLNLGEPNLNKSWILTSPVLEKTEEVRAYLQRCSQNKKVLTDEPKP